MAMGCLATHSALNRFYASAFCMDGAFFLILAAIPFKVLDLLDLGDRNHPAIRHADNVQFAKVGPGQKHPATGIATLSARNDQKKRHATTTREVMCY